MVDTHETVDCLSSYRASRSNREIDEDLLNTCADYPEFRKLKDNKDKLRQNILNQEQTAFTVCYELLLDERLKIKRKQLNENNFSIEPLFKKQAEIFFSSEEDGNIITPRLNDFDIQPVKNTRSLHNWVFGFRCLVSAYSLMLHLFEALVELDLEWKLITNFEMKVRTLNFNDVLLQAIDSKNISPSQYGKNVKFQVNIYKVITT